MFINEMYQSGCEAHRLLMLRVFLERQQTGVQEEAGRHFHKMVLVPHVLMRERPSLQAHVPLSEKRRTLMHIP
jgi:hypothetical protein